MYSDDLRRKKNTHTRTRDGSDQIEWYYGNKMIEIARQSKDQHFFHSQITVGPACQRTHTRTHNLAPPPQLAL